jgi:hypothetical protein
VEYVGTCSLVAAVQLLYEFVQLMFVTSLSTARLLGCGADVTALAQAFSSKAPLFAFVFAGGFLTGTGAG